MTGIVRLQTKCLVTSDAFGWRRCRWIVYFTVGLKLKWVSLLIARDVYVLFVLHWMVLRSLVVCLWWVFTVLAVRWPCNDSIMKIVICWFCLYSFRVIRTVVRTVKWHNYFITYFCIMLSLCVLSACFFDILYEFITIWRSNGCCWEAHCSSCLLTWTLIVIASPQR